MAMILVLEGVLEFHKTVALYCERSSITTTTKTTCIAQKLSHFLPQKGFHPGNKLVIFQKYQ